VREWVARGKDEEGVEYFAVSFNRASSQDTFLDFYANSRAFIVHAREVDPELRTALYSLASLVSFDVYGEVSEEVRDLIAGAKPSYHRVEASVG
jgi:hypothetical protein